VSRTFSFSSTDAILPAMVCSRSRRSSILRSVETRTAPIVNGCSCIFRTTARISSRSPSMIVPMAVSWCFSVVARRIRSTPAT
jgi:hypothetical protein